MKREAKLLLEKGLDSLVLSVEHFNRADDRGRTSAVLILLDHAFEMLLKAAILHRGGRIREPRARETIGFDACVRRGLSDGKISFLTDEQALTLQTINGLRDAAQHHLIDVSEQQLYLHAQAGVTLIRDLLKSVFGRDLAGELPPRVLPISTVAPTDLAALFESETQEIAKLLAPGRRRHTEAYARLRPLAILDATIRGEKLQPTSGKLTSKGQLLVEGKPWNEVFPGAASVEFTADGAGPTLSLRIAKKEGVPIQLVPEGTPGASVVAVKRVDELGYYSLGRNQLAEHVGLTPPKTSAVIWHLKLQADREYYKEIVIGKARFGRYSKKAIDTIKDTIARTPVDEIWTRYKARNEQP